ncbi:hypothetical protein Tco_0548859 [Tanacetum coccineum]
METKSFISKLDKVSSPEGDYLVVDRVNGNFKAFNYIMEIMMESSIEVTDQGDFWNDQQDWEIVTWRLYEAYGVCILEFKDGTCLSTCSLKDIYSSIQGIACKGLMLNFGLEVEVESTATLDLIRHKNWLVHKQMACGKDFSNPFMVDNLPKIVGFSTHLASWLRDNVARRIAKDVKGNFKINEQDLSVCSESIQQPEKKARARQDRGGRAGQLVRVNVDEGRSQTAPVRQAAGAASRIQPHASVLATQQLNKVVRSIFKGIHNFLVTNDPSIILG